MQQSETETLRYIASLVFLRRVALKIVTLSLFVVIK
jgi:hypothetical protein